MMRSMAMRNWVLPGLCVALALSLTSVIRAEEKDQPEAAQLTPEQLEQAFRKFATPGPEHAQFKRLVGNWKTTTKSYHANPEEPAVSEGKARFSVIMGGRYLQQQLMGEFDGEKFTGMGLTGFDNATKKYVGTWIDNMGTGIMTFEGTYDPQTHTMTEVGESSSPFGPMKMKMLSKYIDDDNFLFTMYLVTPDGEQKMMEIKYQRVKKQE